MKEIRKPAPRRVVIGYLLAVLPILLFVMVFLFISSVATVSPRHFAQVLTAITVGLAGILVR